MEGVVGALCWEALMALRLGWRAAGLSLCVSEMGTLSDLDQQTVAAVCGVIALF